MLARMMGAAALTATLLAAPAAYADTAAFGRCTLPIKTILKVPGSMDDTEQVKEAMKPTTRPLTPEEEFQLDFDKRGAEIKLKLYRRDAQTGEELVFYDWFLVGTRSSDSRWAVFWDNYGTVATLTLMHTITQARQVIPAYMTSVSTAGELFVYQGGCDVERYQIKDSASE